MRDQIYSVGDLRAIIAPIAARHGVERIYLFGSYARGEATPSSDLDFRIEKGNVRSLWQFASLQLDLEKGFSKDLDVLTTQMLTPDFLNRIRPEEVLIYARS